MRHPVLGTVTFNPAMLWWEATSPVPLGITDQVSLTVSGLDVPAPQLDEVAALLHRLDPPHLRALVASELLDLYNDTWRQADAPALDHAGFTARIRPAGVDISEDCVEVFFDDGALFGGHSIVLLLDLDLQVIDIKLAG